jgi:adenine-specific DNA-methyltransferase
MNSLKSFDKLKAKLSELFQLDQADLDFGIYRIMNARREEITRFLERDLLPQVREAFKEYQSADEVTLKQELDKAIERTHELGIEPEDVPKVRELQAKYETSAVDIMALENEVYDHLYSFFNRYYDEGDFISLRRYKEGVYAIPYEGEEVKLYWANHDQYYVKTTEYFRDYAFKSLDEKRVHFKIVEADTEKDNIKATNGKDRRFFLHGEKPVTEENGELIIRFEYQPDDQKRRQDAVNAETINRIMKDLATAEFATWYKRLDLKWVRADGSLSDKSILEKHLFDYTRRNTFDYFIHKDLGGFLRRELDFYIKNEVMRLDDIEEESAPRVEQYLSKIKVIRQIAHKIIDFLAQIEDFQKKLWLKKKFVIETNYCVTLDRVSEDLYPEIAKNDAQREEWVRLFAIDEIEKDLAGAVDYSEPLTIDFLKANPFLVLETKFFGEEFKDRLLASFEDVENTTDGVMLYSENFQALNLARTWGEGRFDCVYIDPPYNTSENTFMYKNEYKHSSWISMMANRISLARSFLPIEGVMEVAIDDTEIPRLRMLLDSVFGSDNRVATIAAEVNPAGQNLRPNAPALSHDYCHIYAKEINRMQMLLRGLTEEEEKVYREKDEKGTFLWDNLRRRGGNSRPSDRPKQWFPLFVDLATKQVSVDPFEGAQEVWPIDPKGERRIWRVNPDGARREIAAGEVSVIEKGGRIEVVKKTHKPEGKKPKSLWKAAAYSATTHGTKLLIDILGRQSFSYPKSLFLVRDCLQHWVDENGLVLDFFAGSGTTGHAVVELNRQDNGMRRYVLFEMGQHFDEVMLPRMKKVVYSKDWKNGKPVSRHTGVSHMFKYIRLESYEDALANIELRRTPQQQMLLDRSQSFKESYLLKYMLDTEAKGSRTLLNIDHFEDPFSYKLLVGTGSVGETKAVNMDLVETFNWLLGLKVRRMDLIRGFKIVEGTNPKGERVLVIWRKIRDMSETDEKKITAARLKANQDLDAFFKKQQYNTPDSEFDVIYVNGDNNLMNIPVKPEVEGREPRYKVRLIEEEFKKLMFDVQDV